MFSLRVVSHHHIIANGKIDRLYICLRVMSPLWPRAFRFTATLHLFVNLPQNHVTRRCLRSRSVSLSSLLSDLCKCLLVQSAPLVERLATRWITTSAISSFPARFYPVVSTAIRLSPFVSLLYLTAISQQRASTRMTVIWLCVKLPYTNV